MQWRIQAFWKAGILVWVPKVWRPQNTFQVVFFQLYFIKQYVDAAINDSSNPSNYFEMAYKAKMQTEAKNND